MILTFKSVADVSYWTSQDPLHNELVARMKDDSLKDVLVTVFIDKDTKTHAPKDVGDSIWQGQWTS